MQGRTITVRGKGSASALADLVELTLRLESIDKNYEKAMDKSAESVEGILRAFEERGFDKDDVKTTNFNVRTDYQSRRDKDGNYISEFNGYAVGQSLKITFAFEPERLSQALAAVAESGSKPQVGVRFAVSDAAALREDVLAAAAMDAKAKAEILCRASGAKLGALKSIDYGVISVNVYSETNYDVEEACFGAAPMMKARAVEINPEDVTVNDDVTFVWELD